MKIAILGAGQLGIDVHDYLKKEYSCKLFSHSNFDICNISQLHEIVKENDIIINCVANINADKIENEERDDSFNVNFLAVNNLAILCRKYEKKLIHISSDYVYGSNDYNDDLTEDFNCNPINQYGIDKLNGENTILENNIQNYLILRVAWLCGKYGKFNFIQKIKNNLKNNKEIKVVDDQIGNITSTSTVCKVIDNYLKGQIPNGIFNVQNNDKILSRYDIACKIKNILHSKCNIIACKTNEFPLPAKRQLNSNLNTEKIRKYLDLDSYIQILKELLK